MQHALWQAADAHACMASPVRCWHAQVASLQSFVSKLGCVQALQAMMITQGLFLQGLDDPKLIFQAVPSSLAGRKFELPASAIRVTNIPKRIRASSGFGSSFMSGELTVL